MAIPYNCIYVSKTDQGEQKESEEKRGKSSPSDQTERLINIKKGRLFSNMNMKIYLFQRGKGIFLIQL